MLSCQSLAGPAKQQVLVRGEAGANGRCAVVGPFDLPPLSSGPPQQIEPPAGRHGAHHGPMLRAHMPQNTNSHLHTNTHGVAVLPALRHKHKLHPHKHCSVVAQKSYTALNTRASQLATQRSTHTQTKGHIRQEIFESATLF